ncbi:MAG: exo-alpha-sialidase, partial [Clostridia bacterium]|nr:exo-alpha-sialidase [Clostridia bacterium]
MNPAKKLIAFILSVSMLVSLCPSFNVTFTAETMAITNPFTVGTGGSQSFRIPAMVTLSDGTIVAAADMRWNTTYDGGGLDTLVATSRDGGLTWTHTKANYLGDNGDAYNAQSSSFIDSCLTVAPDGKTVYLLCDLYPYGVALNGNGSQTLPSTEVGFNSDGYLKLRRDTDPENAYNYYLKDGKIYGSDGEVSGYSVDSYFNITYKNSEGVVELTSNLFYANSPFKVVRTGYLYLTSSSDGGEHWSAPTLLNLKNSSENVCLASPGNGITTSDDTIVFPVYSYSTSTQKLGFIYSVDGG